MSERIRIVSDGLVHGTQVLMPDGTPIQNVSAIEILPLRSGGDVVQARVTLMNVELEIQAAKGEAAADALALPLDVQRALFMPLAKEWLKGGDRLVEGTSLADEHSFFVMA